MENKVLDLESQIKNALPQGVKIVSCKESAYLKTYVFSAEIEIATIHFHYNSKNKITKIRPKENSEFAKMLCESFSNIAHLYANPIIIDEYEFSRESLKDLFEVLKDRLSKEAIIIKGYPQDFSYRQRYTFQKGNLIAIFDFIYNESGEITNVTNMPNNCDSSEFVERLKAIFAEIFSDNEVDNEQ